MAKSKRPLIQDNSPATNELTTKTPKSKRSSKSKSRKASQSRSKSRSRKGNVSKARGRSRSRSRSRAKSKSPKRKARSRSRSRSRSIKTAPLTPIITRSRGRSKSKTRKTEAAAVNELVDIIQQKKITPTYKDNRDDFLYKESKLNEIIRRSISRELSQEQTNIYKVSSNSSILTTLKEKEFKNYDGKINEIKKLPNLSKAPLSIKKHSFALPEWFKALFGLIVPPLVVLALHIACSRKQCSLSNLLNIPRNWKYYFNLEAGYIVVGFFLLQSILSLLPIGKKVDGPPGINGILQYRCNGLLCTVLTAGIVAGLWHYKLPVTIVNDKLIAILISCTIFAYVLGLILFIKGEKAPIPGMNPSGIVGSKLHQFFVGREINPFLFGKINVKVVLMRTCLNGMLLINAVIILKAYEAKQELSYSLLTNFGLLALLVFDFFWFENTLPHTFEAVYEGTGCSLVLNYLLYPFLPALVTKYIIQHKVELPLWVFVAIAIGFIVGFIIYRSSNLQKAAFRKSPLNPALSKVEAISTNRGKKLLVTGWWGWVRHPNYLGSIILLWAWAMTCGWGQVTPYLVPLIITVLLMHRAYRVDAFCGQRYQSAWNEYCSRVQYRIFPHVY